MTRTGRLLGSAALATTLAFAGGAIAPIVGPAELGTASAQQGQPSMEVFETELAPYGAWIDHPKYGRVWTPTNMPQDWRPYTTGRWEWTDDDGWYWQADETWGWIPFHYGRWFLDNQFGWLWVPGLVWGPAWVSWRETDDGYLGWAPLPPEDIDVASAGPGDNGPPLVPGPTATSPAPGVPQGYVPPIGPVPVQGQVVEDNPAYWTFVPQADFTAPSIYQVRVPPQEVQVYLPRTRNFYRSDVRVDGDVPRGFNRGFDRVYVERFSRRPIEVRRQPPRLLETEIIRRRGPNAPELRAFRDNRFQEGNRVRERNVRIRDEQDRNRDRRNDNQRQRNDNQQRPQNQPPRFQDQQQGNQQRQRQDERQQRQQEREQQERQQQRQDERQQQQRQEERQQQQRQDEREKQQRQQEREQQRNQQQRQDERQQQQRQQERQQQEQEQERQEQERQKQQRQQERQQDREQQDQERQKQQRQQERQQEREQQERQKQQRQDERQKDQRPDDRQQRQQEKQQQRQQDQQQRQQEKQQRQQEKQQEKQQRQQEKQQRQNQDGRRNQNCQPGQPDC